MQKTYYKVVYHDNATDTLLSCITRSVEYIKDQFVYSPNVGRLCVFDTYNHAVLFTGYNEEIWRCEIGKIYKYSRIPEYLKPYRMLFGCEPPTNYTDKYGCSDIYMDKLASLIKAKKKYTDCIYLVDDFPVGTIFTDKVKLTKKLSSKEDLLSH